MHGRRAFLVRCAGAAVAACGGSACGGPPPRPPPPPELALALDPIAGLLPAPRLEWLVEVRCREVWSHAALREAISVVVPEARLAAFAVSHGGIDLRELDELVVASYAGGTTVVAARAALDPSRVEAAFSREVEVQGRTATHAEALHPVVRTWGVAGAEPRSLVLFGRRGVLHERGPSVASRAAIAFAEGRLRRATPALRSPPLAAAAALAGPAPLRVFFPGPFEGEQAKGLGGLLAATTAVVLTVAPSGSPAAVQARAWVLGAWGEGAKEALEPLRATYTSLAGSDLGRLCGLQSVIPTLTYTPDALHAEAALEPLTVARGLHATLDASVSEIMK